MLATSILIAVKRINYKQRIMFAGIKKFFVESRQEIRHVNWPTRQEAIRLTIIVIGIALGLAIFLGAFDYLFSYLIKNFILRNILEYPMALHHPNSRRAKRKDRLRQWYAVQTYSGYEEAVVALSEADASNRSRWAIRFSMFWCRRRRR